MRCPGELTGVACCSTIGLALLARCRQATVRARHCRLGTVWGRTARGDAVRADAGVEGVAAEVAVLSDF
jgi:hypothetical protein